MFERKCINESLELGLHLSRLILPKHPRYLGIVTKIFDPSLVYYAGTLRHL
jgi:hypothetical protein